jgi:hypothetical protein
MEARERFRCEVELVAGDGLYVTVTPWIDTDVPYSRFPLALLARLGHQPGSTRKFRAAGGAIVDIPVGDVPLRIGNEVQSHLCVFGGDDEMVIGRLTLATFCLEPDYESKTLIPGVALLVTPREVQ